MKIKVKTRIGQRERMLATRKAPAFPEKLTKSDIKKSSRMKREGKKSEGMTDCCGQHHTLVRFVRRKRAGAAQK